MHRCDRSTGNAGGGVIVAVNSDVISTREESLESATSEMIWVKINVRGCKTLFVGGCYRVKINDEAAPEDLDSALMKISRKQIV